MKRMTLIAITLCLIMLTTVGAGVVAAQQEANPRQAGESSIYFYDVAPAPDGTHGTGKLQIDTAKHTFVFNGKDFTPDAMIKLKARAEDGSDNVFATGKATPSGNLHIAGTWEAGAALPGEVATGYEQISGFMLGNDGGFVAKLACYYSTNGGATWTESSHTDGITMGNSIGANPGDLGVPDGALVKIHAIVVAGKDRTGSEVFQLVKYPPDDYWSRGRADYDITGTTMTSKLTFLGRVPGCPASGINCWCLGGCY